MAAATEASDIKVGPITEIVTSAKDLFVSNLPNDLRWTSLLLMVGIAITIWVIRRGNGARGADGRIRKAGLIEYLLPRDIYTHQSARVDIGLYVFERFLRPLWVGAAFIAVAPATEKTVIAGLSAVFGTGPALESNMAWMLLYSLVSLLLYDFFFFLIHYAEHKIPALWAIHKVHHSAEVLTPLTRYREHVLEGPIYAFGSALALGLAGGIFGWMFASEITRATLFNVSFFALVLGFTSAFRHYHVAFHYPVWLSKWLHAPVMHHIHHSYLQQHWDKNFAVVTSIWDRMFGTLYIPVMDEYTPLGLGPETQAEYRTFWQNTSGPFRDWYAMITKRKSPQAGALQEQ